MATRQLLRYLSEHKLDPKVKYVVEKSKLVPAKSEASKLEKVHTPIVNVAEEIVQNFIESTAIQESAQVVEMSVNEQITDAVTQSVTKNPEIPTEAKPLVATKKKKPLKNK